MNDAPVRKRYDAVLKDLFVQDRPAVLEILTGGIPVREFLNVEFPIILEQRADLVLRLDDGSIKHIEFQSRNDDEMAYREGIYGIMIARMYRPARVSQTVLYFGIEEMNMVDHLDLGEIKTGYQLMDIRDLDAESLIRTGRPGDLALAMLARGGTEMLRRILERTKALKAEDRSRALVLLTFLAGLRHLSDALRLELKAMDTDYIDIQENAVLRDWLAQAEALAEARGEARGEAKILRRLLEAKFGVLPAWAEERISKSSVDQLEALFPAVLTSDSLQGVIGPE